LYQGTTLVGPHTPNKNPGFSPWAFFWPTLFSRSHPPGPIICSRNKGHDQRVSPLDSRLERHHPQI